MKNKVRNLKTMAGKAAGMFQRTLLKKRPGIDGIVVTVGLSIIALLLCVVMKDSLASFVETIVQSLTTNAQNILSGV